jgi:hypothetical protein
MAMQLSTGVRNALLDAIETQIGAGARLQIWSGGMPATPATAATGTKLAEFALPSDWMAAAAAGSKALLGTWSGTGLAAAGAGTNAGYFRITTSTASQTIAEIQGTITVTGGGGDMTLDNISIAQNQTVVVNSFTLTAPNP